MTHPYHPLCGREFDLVMVHFGWGDERVVYVDGDDVLKRIPAQWTDLAPVDPFVHVAAGRSFFRIEDLLRLAQLVARLG